VTATRWEKRLNLPQVTICAVTSVNVKATMRALEASLGQIAFAECLLLTDADLLSDNREIRVVPIERIGSSAAYSDFVLNQLVDHVETSHCLIVQWDGHVLNAERWASAFLDYDYIGASWPQFDDGYDVAVAAADGSLSHIWIPTNPPGRLGNRPHKPSVTGRAGNALRSATPRR